MIGGLWITNLNYWGCNQYITQRALGADLKTARTGILFAAFLKLLMPVIVVLPGIAAFILYKENIFHSQMMVNGELNPDNAYPSLLRLLPPWFKGLSLAALTAAVVASLAGKANSIATIFTLDIYKKKLKTDATDQKLVVTGKIAIVCALVVGYSSWSAPFMGIDKKGGFQFIQEYTGFVSPGIFAMFLLGFFWKKTTSDAALFATIGGFIMSVILKVLPKFMDLAFLKGTGFSTLVLQSDKTQLYEIPFHIEPYGYCIFRMRNRNVYHIDYSKSKRRSYKCLRGGYQNVQGIQRFCCWSTYNRRNSYCNYSIFW